MRRLWVSLLILGLLLGGLTLSVFAQKGDPGLVVQQIQQEIPLALTFSVAIDGENSEITVPLTLNLSLDVELADTITIRMGEEVVAEVQPVEEVDEAKEIVPSAGQIVIYGNLAYRTKPAEEVAVQESATTPTQLTHALSRHEQCGKCHDPESGREPAPVDHQGMTDDLCLYCHMPEEGEEAVPLLPEEAETDFCLSCHGPYEDLQERTTDYVTDQDLAGNPHPNTPHEGTNMISCDACHNVHSLPVTSLAEIEQATVQYCFLACHHTEDFRLCDDCHEDE